MVHPARVKSKGLNGVPHLPFQEFAVPSLEAFLSVLKKAKIRDSEIEVSSSVESQHTMCSRPLIHVLVMTAKGSGPAEYRDLAALYRYCPGCRTAVRIL